MAEYNVMYMREGGREGEREAERQRRGERVVVDDPMGHAVYILIPMHTHTHCFQWISGLLGAFSQKWSEGKSYYLEETVSQLLSNMRA